MVVIDHVEYKSFKSLIDLATTMGVEHESFEGSLMSNFIFYDAQEINVNGHSAKYIISQERFKNSQESDYSLILTNDIKKTTEYEEIFQA